jgi:hypothetical protein
MKIKIVFILRFLLQILFILNMKSDIHNATLDDHFKYIELINTECFW